MVPLLRAVQSLAALIGCAAILLAFSEFIFLNEEPAIDLLRQDLMSVGLHIGELVLFYCMPAAVWLGLLRLVRPDTWWRITLCGAIVGWSIEGAMVPAVYEGPPFSFFWTSVSWHAFVDVAFGLWLLPRVLNRSPFLLVPVGFLWALWSTWTWESGLIFDPQEFLILALFVSFCVIAGLVMMRWGQAAVQAWPKWLAWAAFIPSVLTGAIWGLSVWIWAIPLFALVALTAAALSPGQHAPDYTAPALWWLLAPLAAVPAYFGLWSLEIVPLAEMLILPVAFVGAIAFVWAIRQGFMRDS